MDDEYNVAASLLRRLGNGYKYFGRIHKGCLLDLEYLYCDVPTDEEMQAIGEHERRSEEALYGYEI